MSSKPHSKADQAVEKAVTSPPPIKGDTLSWDRWFEGEGVADDFMNDRDQPTEQHPER